MMLQLQRPLVFVDLETTGLDAEKDRIVELGMVRLHPDGRRERLVERVDPGMDIPENASRVHGIHTDEVRGLFGKPKLAKLGSRLLDFVCDADLAGFNSHVFDVPLLAQECRRHQIPLLEAPRLQIDVKLVFHNKETSWDRFLMGPRDLSAAVRFYLGREHERAHKADADAEATADVLLAQLQRYPDLPRVVRGLHDYCAGIAAQLARAAG